MAVVYDPEYLAMAEQEGRRARARLARDDHHGDDYEAIYEQKRWRARQRQPDPLGRAGERRGSAQSIEAGETVTAVESPEFSDDHLALTFTAAYASDLRFVPVWGKWFRWDEARWKEDTTLMAFDLARKVVRRAAGELQRSGCNNPNGPKNLASAKTVAAVEKLARADQRHAERVGRWDADQWFISSAKE